jgi:iron complex outermembrane receptor protein
MGFFRVFACWLIFLLLFPAVSFSQPAPGKNIIVLDSATFAAVPGAAVSINGGIAFLTNENGKIMLPVHNFPFTISIRAVSFLPLTITISKADQLKDTFFLSSESRNLGEVVVTAGKQGQKIENVTQSIELIKPDLILQTQTTQIQEAITKLPGIEVQKDQMTIRGISGFSYGAGSRVLILLDDMPMLSAGSGDAKWNYYPLENLQQVEVLKGAASALYGSSALEGIVHLRTAIAADTPYTQVRLFSGVYDKPYRKETAYWGNQSPPGQYGISLAHRQTFGQFKITASAYGFNDEGFRQGDHEQWLRGNLFVQYSPKKSHKYIAGGALNGLISQGSNFLFFGDVNQPYLPYPGTLSDFVNSRWNADAFVKFYPDNTETHIVRSRFFSTINKNNTNQGSANNLSFNEYQYQKKLLTLPGITSTLTTGVNYIYSYVLGGALYGNHNSNNFAGYIQLDQKIKRFTASAGARMELNKMDQSDWTRFPVFRAGVNEQVGKAGFLRLSIGQGFRYPTIAEKFTQTSSGAINIFPNPNLVPESGWNSELGYRQLFAWKKFRGFADAAFFWAEYTNMIEYQFGLYPPPHYNPLDILKYIGFEAKNIPETHIKGAEFSFSIAYKTGKSEFTLSGGYTRIIPLDLRYQNKDTIERLYYLKYRRPDLVRLNLTFTRGRWEAGVFYQYNSSFLNIDDFFLQTIKGLSQNDYWRQYSQGNLVDIEAGYKILKNLRMSLSVKNLLNKEYMEIPGNTNAPRMYMVQISDQF